MQSTVAHGNQDDDVGVLMHRRQEATEPLTQNSKVILHDTPGTRQPVTVCKRILVGSVTDGRMASPPRFGEQKRHLVRSDRTQAGHHLGVVPVKALQLCFIVQHHAGNCYSMFLCSMHHPPPQHPQRN